MADSGSGNRALFGSGDRVVLLGLQARPELNDQEGVVEAFDEAIGRWRVILPDETVAVKDVNIRLIASDQTPAPEAHASSDLVQVNLRSGDQVLLHSLKSRLELNDQVGTIDAYDESTGRWTVLLATETVAVKVTNLRACQTAPLNGKADPLFVSVLHTFWNAHARNIGVRDSTLALILKMTGVIVSNPTDPSKRRPKATIVHKKFDSVAHALELLNALGFCERDEVFEFQATNISILETFAAQVSSLYSAESPSNSALAAAVDTKVLITGMCVIVNECLYMCDYALEVLTISM